MKIIYNQKINRIVEYLIPDHLRKIDGLVIAGGFSTYLYYLSKSPDEKIDQVIKCLKFNLVSREIIEMKALIGDVDYWIIENTDANNYFSKVTPQFSDKESKIVSKEEFVSKNKEICDYYTSIDSSVVRAKLTKWALTLNYHLISKDTLIFNHQIIRYKVWKDLESVLSDFDIDICRVAWYKNQLYISENAFDNFQNKKLTFNEQKPFKEGTPQSISSVIRFYKYYKRYGFEPEKYDISNVLLNYFFAAEFIKDHKEQIVGNYIHPLTPVILKTFNVHSIVNPNNIIDKDDEAYDNSADINKTLLLGYCANLIKDIGVMFSFKNFEPHKAAYFIGMDSYTDDIVQKYLKLIVKSKLEDE